VCIFSLPFLLVAICKPNEALINAALPAFSIIGDIVKDGMTHTFYSTGLNQCFLSGIAGAIAASSSMGRILMTWPLLPLNSILTSLCADAGVSEKQRPKGKRARARDIQGILRDT
jgi:hypothetical protein